MRLRTFEQECQQMLKKGIRGLEVVSENCSLCFHESLLLFPRCIPKEPAKIQSSISRFTKQLDLLVVQLSKKLALASSNGQQHDWPLSTQTIKCIWPSLLRGIGSEKLKEVFGVLRHALDITEKDLCFLVIEHNRNPNQYPLHNVEFVIRQFHTNLERLDYEQCIIPLLYDECSQAFYDLTSITHEYSSPDTNSVYVLKAIEKHVKKCLARKKRILEVLKAQSDPLLWARTLNTCLKKERNLSILLKILRLMLLMECLNFFYTEIAQRQEYEQKALKKICVEGLSRILKYLYSSNFIVKCLLMKWITVSKRSENGIWSQASQLHTSLILHLKILQQTETEKKPNILSSLILESTEELLEELQGQYQQLPKIYQRAIQENMVPIQNRDILEATETASISKTLPSHKQIENYEMALISEILKRIEVQQFHKIHILLFCLLKSLRESLLRESLSVKQSATLSQPALSTHHRNKPSRQMDLMRIYMSLHKAIGKCDAFLRCCKLMQQINVSLFQLTGYLPENYENCITKIQQSLKNSEYIDFEWQQASQGPSVEGIIPNFLNKSQQYYDLLTMYELAIAEEEYNRNFSSVTSKISRKQPMQPQFVINLQADSLMHTFTGRTARLLASYIKNEQSLQLMIKIMNCNSICLRINIFLNIFNYAVGIEGDARTSKAKEALKQIMNEYLHRIDIRALKQQRMPLEQQQEYLQLKQLLLKAPVYLQQFKKVVPSTRDRQNNKKTSTNSKGQSASQRYIDIMLKCSDTQQLLKIVEEYEEINCIKEALYFFNYFFRMRGNTVKSLNDINEYYGVLHRMDANITKCIETLQSSVAKNEENEGLAAIFDLRDSRTIHLRDANKGIQIGKFVQGNELAHKFYPYLNSLIFYCEGMQQIQQGLFQGSHQLIGKLEEGSEICEAIRDIRYLATILRFIRFECTAQAVLNNITHINFFENSEFVLHFVATSLNRSPDKKVTTKLIEQFKWDELLRFQKYRLINKRLQAKLIENMNLEELRAGLISNSKLCDYEKALIYSHELVKRNSKQEKTSDRYIQLSFYSVVAKYKAMIMYPFKNIIADWELILQAFEGDNGLPLSRANTEVVYEIYRFISENYTNLSSREEQYILEVLLKYYSIVEDCRVDTSEDICHQQIEKEAFYFILRFLFRSSCNEDLVSTFCSKNYRPETIIAFQDFLILNIDSTPTKNELIEQLLTNIAEYSPVSSCWWISSLLFHCYINEKPKRPYTRNDHILTEMGNKVLQSLRRKCIDVEQHLQWIQRLLKLGITSTQDDNDASRLIKQLKEERVPESMTCPFDRSLQLLRISAIKDVGDGKSKPKAIAFKALNRSNQSLTVQIIVKKTSEGCMNYQVEKCAANFFKACGVVDREVTYSIVNLCKYCIAIEHIPHYDSLRSVMDSNQANQIKLQQNLSRITGYGKRMRTFYDQEIMSFKYNLYEFLTGNYRNPIREWWKRYTNFISTYAQWAFLGYTVGLGDRHDANCLVKDNGKIIQIDFEYIFSYGLLLPCPEWVPMRMTKNMCSQLSIVQPYGLMYSEFTKAAHKYRENQRQFWAALSYLMYTKQNQLQKPICKRAELDQNIYESSFTLLKQSNDSSMLREMFVGWGAHR